MEKHRLTPKGMALPLHDGNRKIEEITSLPGRKIDGVSVLPLLQGDFENTIRNEY